MSRCLYINTYIKSPLDYKDHELENPSVEARQLLKHDFSRLEIILNIPIYTAEFSVLIFPVLNIDMV